MLKPKCTFKGRLASFSRRNDFKCVWHINKTHIENGISVHILYMMLTYLSRFKDALFYGVSHYPILWNILLDGGFSNVCVIIYTMLIRVNDNLTTAQFKETLFYIK